MDLICSLFFLDEDIVLVSTLVFEILSDCENVLFIRATSSFLRLSLAFPSFRS